MQFYASDNGPKLPYPRAGTALVQGMRAAIVDAMPSSWPWRAYPNCAIALRLRTDPTDVEQSSGLPNWPKRYFGANYPRLQQLKAQYDPDLRFVCTLARSSTRLTRPDDTSVQLPLKPIRTHRTHH